MSEYRAITRYVRISPRKARLAADLIRGLSVNEARYQLDMSLLKGGRLLQKTLNSAVANAELLSDIKVQDMIVKEVRVDEGPRLKRGKPRSRGMRNPILKRTSHFTIVVSALVS